MLSACLIVKNEGLFLREWLEYHLLAGFDHFYIYDNNSTDDILDQLAPYETVLTYVTWPLTDQQQRHAYRHCLDNYGAESLWMAFIDADEFVVYKGEGTLRQYLESKINENGIMMQWVLFGTSGHRSRPPGLVTENYVQCHAQSPTPNIKTVCQPLRVSNAPITSPHRFAYCDGRPGVPETLAVVAVYHYVTRSLQDLAAKIGRGDVWSAARAPATEDDVAMAIADKLALYDGTDETDLHMLRFAPLIREKLRHRGPA